MKGALDQEGGPSAAAGTEGDAGQAFLQLQDSVNMIVARISPARVVNR